MAAAKQTTLYNRHLENNGHMVSFAGYLLPSYYTSINSEHVAVREYAGHFDVIHMNQVLPHAWELVEDGVMSLDDFREFTFANPARFWTSNDPNFFAGTKVEAEVAELFR